MPLLGSLFVIAFELIFGARDSMWVDEGFTVRMARKPLGGLLRILWSDEANMGPYYLAQWFWVRINDGDLWIRSFSALATVAAVWAIWLLVRKWSGELLAGVAVAVFVLTPFVLSWSMQARAYSAAMACAAWSLVFADKIVEGKRWWFAAGFGVMIGLGTALQLSTACVFAGVVVAVVAQSPTRHTARMLATAGAAAAIVFAPFANAVMHHPNQADWISELTPSRFSSAMMTITGGPLWALLIATGLVNLIAAMVRRDVRARPYLLALAGLISGVIGLVAISIFVRPMFVDRYLIGCIPMAVIAAVGGWSALRARVWSVVAVIVVAVSIVNLGLGWNGTRPFAENYRAAASMYLASARPGDALVAIGEFPILGLVRYLPDGVATESIVSDESNPDLYVIRDQSSADVQPNRIWILHRDVETTPELEAWIERQFPTVNRNRRFGAIRLELRSRSGPSR